MMNEDTVFLTAVTPMLKFKQYGDAKATLMNF